jgi:hypothetical protein
MKTAVVVLVMLSLASPVWSQSAGANRSLDEIFTLDLPVPESPAFDVLDLNPESVVRPASPREFATTLLNGVDRRGNFQTGLAIDTVPFLLAPWSNSVTIADYQANPEGFNEYRILGRTALSLATVKGATDDDKAWRAAAGLNVTPYDAGDPRMDLELQRELREIEGEVLDAMERPNRAVVAAIMDLPTDVGDQVLALNPGIRPRERAQWDAYDHRVDEAKRALRTLEHEHKNTPTEPQIARVAELFEQQRTSYDLALQSYAPAAKRARERSKKRNWKATSWHLGGAPRWVSDNGAIDKLTFDGGALWTSLGVGTKRAPDRDADLITWVRDSSQLVLHVRGRLDAAVADPDDESELRNQDDVLAGVRVRVGVPWLAVNASAAYLYADPEGADTEQLARYTVGINVRLAEGWWIELVGGGQSGGTDEEDQAFVLSSIKFAPPEGGSPLLPGS